MEISFRVLSTQHCVNMLILLVTSMGKLYAQFCTFMLIYLLHKMYIGLNVWPRIMFHSIEGKELLAGGKGG